MLNRDLLSGLFLLLLSTGACILSYRLDLGSGSNPGPGFIPFGIAALLGLMSFYLCVHGAILAARSSGEEHWLPMVGWKKAMLVLVILTAYGFSFTCLGFIPSTFLLMMLLLWPIGRQRLRVSLIVSILTVVCSDFLFVVVLQLPLPQGVLEQWLR